MLQHEVRVFPLPVWLDAPRLLGTGFRLQPHGPDGRLALAMLDTVRAAEVQARLHRVGIGGAVIRCEVSPPLSRSAVRNARLAEARRRRERSAGFTRSGVRLDAEAKLGLTPEVLALAIGEHARRSFSCVVDLCAGAGGNAIGFARAGCTVIAIERDPRRAEMLEHNARLYRVGNRIEVVCDDVLAWLRRGPRVDPELWFIDPPWGGRYDPACVELAALPPLADVLALRPAGQALLAKVPPSFDLRETPAARPRAVFGAGKGDAQRVKLLLLEL